MEGYKERLSKEFAKNLEERMAKEKASWGHKKSRFDFEMKLLKKHDKPEDYIVEPVEGESGQEGKSSLAHMLLTIGAAKAAEVKGLNENEDEDFAKYKESLKKK